MMFVGIWSGDERRILKKHGVQPRVARMTYMKIKIEFSNPIRATGHFLVLPKFTLSINIMPPDRGR